jgi:hypothetical protein
VREKENNMPGFTYVHYDGSDEKIIELVSKLVSGNGGNHASPAAPISAKAVEPSTWDDIARRFAQHINAAAAAGNPGQKNAMMAWLKANGEILLTKLWKAAGVKVQHDYSGVGGSMTKNMMKAKGPKEWYTGSLNSDNEWVYKIVPVLVEPLKRGFGL